MLYVKNGLAMFPTWKKTSKVYSRPGNLEGQPERSYNYFCWLMVGSMRLPLDLFIQINKYENHIEFKIVGLTFLLGSICAPKSEVLDLGKHKLLISQKQVIGFKNSSLKIAVPESCGTKIFSI